MNDPTVPLTVLGGYLGAGKTTVVNWLLHHAAGRRLAVLVNDFGEVNVDAEILRASDDGVVELSGGCVCCDLSLGMGPALATLLARSPRPDQVIVEVSGVGEPASVAAWGATPGLHLDGVVVAVALDQVRRLADDRWVGDLVTAQLAQADLLVCTHGDLVPTGERSAVADWLRTFSTAPQLAAPNGSVPPAAFFGIDATLSAGAHAPQPHSTHHHGTPDVVRSSTWRCSGPVDLDQLRTSLTEADGFLRAKGFVRGLAEPDRWMLVQAVGRHVTLTPWESPRGQASAEGEVLVILTTPDLTEQVVAGSLPGWRRSQG